MSAFGGKADIGRAFIPGEHTAAVTEDALPVIGTVAGIDGAYVATGHSVWGMLNAPATGEAMGELIMDGAARRVDLAPFAPGRLPPLDPVRLHGASG
jgi:glycine/D-amino acid oxidase-like deaminating enzyme